MAKELIERNYIIGFGKVIGASPRTKKARRAIVFIKRFMNKHFKVKEEKVLVSNEVNNAVWAKGREKIPRKLEVKAVKHDGVVRVLLPNEEFKPKEEKPVKGKASAPAVKKEEKPKEAEKDSELKELEEKELEEKKKLEEKELEEKKKLEEKRIKEQAAEGRAFRKK